MWPIARDISQWVEPDVRSLGYAASAFIVDKARRLSIPLTGSVSPYHLLRPVHSSGRRCVASAFIKACPFLWQAMPCPFHRRQAACLSIPLAGNTPILQTGKTLRPLLIFGFRAGAFRHPAEEFPL
jgi:hypothetical protein